MGWAEANIQVTQNQVGLDGKREVGGCIYLLIGDGPILIDDATTGSFCIARRVCLAVPYLIARDVSDYRKGQK